MKRTLAVLLTMAIATPVVSIPLAADAQVRVGAGVRRDTPRRPAPPRLTDAEQDRLDAATDEVAQLDAWTAEINAQAEAAGGLTDAQKALLEDYAERRETAQEVIDRLEAKLNR